MSAFQSSLSLGLIDPKAVTLYWYVVRGSGFVVFLLLTLAVCLGLLLSLRWRSDAWPRMIVEDLHKYILLTAAIFLALHIVSTLLDSFVKFQLYQVLVPFTGGYRPVWMSLGIISMYLGIALAASGYVRKLIGYRLWRTMHYGGFLAWVSALVHGITTGTDTKSTWAIAVYGISCLLVLGLLAIRFGGVPIPLGRPPRYRPRVIAGLAGGAALAAGLVALGPLQSGWAAMAGQAQIHLPTTQTAVQNVPTSAIQENISGTANADNAATQPGTALVHLRLSGQSSFPLNASYGLLLQQGFGGAQFLHGVFSLAPSSLSWNCSGPVTFQPPGTLASDCTLPNHQTFHVTTQFSIDNSGNVSGQLVASPSGGSSTQGQGQNTSSQQAPKYESESSGVES